MKDDFKPLRPEPAFVPVQAEPQQNFNQNQPSEEGGFSPTPHVPGTALPTPQPNVPKPQKPHTGKKWHPRTWWHWFKGLSRNKKIIVVSALTGLLVVLGAIFWYYVLRAEPAPPPPPPPPPVVKEEPKPTTVASPLTGVQVKPKLAKLPVTGIMIENSPDARPQAGLYDAGVVFEAIAEGGITRFLTLFQESKPEYIGPVRSVRPYYLDFLAPFDAPIAHAGGSGQALAEIAHQGFKDIDHGANAATYERVSNRYAPHNLYTSRAKLLAVHKARGWNTSKFRGFTRKEEKKAAKPTARSISFNISSYLYNVRFDYHAKTNSYKRFMGGAPHIDERAKKAVNPKVVVALSMSHAYAGIYSVYGAKGKGAAFFFQDGTVVRGTWEKPNRKSQFRFKDAKGKELGLNPGRTWVTIVSSPSAVTYKP